MTDEQLYQVLKVEKRCKLCVNPKTAELSDLVARWRLGMPHPATGEKLTESWFDQHAKDYGLASIHSRNLAAHTRHLAIGANAARAQTGTAVELAVGEELARRVEAGLPEVKSTDFLRRIVTIANEKAAVDPARVTVADGLTASRILAQRAHDEEEAAFRAVAGAALLRALEKQGPQGGGGVQLAREFGDQAEDVVDAEVVDEASGEVPPASS